MTDEVTQLKGRELHDEIKNQQMDGGRKEYNPTPREHNDTAFKGRQTKRKTSEEEETIKYSTLKKDIIDRQNKDKNLGGR